MDTSVLDYKRKSTMTEKARDEKVYRLNQSRKAKFGQLTQQAKELERLMNDYANVDTVRLKCYVQYQDTYKELCNLNTQLTQTLPQSEFDDDQVRFAEKVHKIQDIMHKVETWINHAEEHREQDMPFQKEKHDDNMSAVSAASSKRSALIRRPGSDSGSSCSSSARLKAEMERAELQAKIGALKQKQEIERQENELRAKKEQLELHTAMAATDARLKVLDEFENGCPSLVSFKHGTQFQLNSANSPSVKSMPLADLEEKTNSFQVPHALSELISRQNDISELMVKHQKTSMLPPLDIPIFNGDPLDYHLFSRAFEHGVEARTDSAKDCLYYLEQFTRGQPRELVKSCFHMNPDAGYRRAKKLLKEHFGNDYKISVAYMDKALSWDSIKAEDGDSLYALSLFLTACCNTMFDVSYMEEMDNASNLKAIVAKLPYKLREKWRANACSIQDRDDRRVKFKDLVDFINSQVKVAMHPVFGDIKDRPTPKNQIDQRTQKRGMTKKTFTTSATPLLNEKNDVVNSAEAATKTCQFCKEEHSINLCKMLKIKPHKEKIQFLQSKGLCFGCLKHGHLSKSCKSKLSCQVCSLNHPTVLHIDKKDTVNDQQRTGYEEKHTVTSLFVSADTKRKKGLMGAGDDECMLTIVPVRVKSKKGDKIVETYAFLDAGSSSSFCTEDLMKELRLSGRKTAILLKTMNDEKPVNTYVVSNLEVGSLTDDQFIDLPDVFTQKNIPVGKENIPQKKDLERWTYLEKVHLPQIKANVGLLIGANVPKAMEPWEVISSVDGGPFAVRTKLGWTVNGPLKENCGKQVKAMVNRLSVTRLEDLWLQQFKVDFPESEKHEQVEMSREDHQFMDMVMESTKLIDGHYTICLPVKNKMVNMPNNRQAAEQRALSLKRKFQRNPSFHEEYTAFMNDLLIKGYAVQLSDAELERNDGRIWYIPHHGVYHQVKQKIRVVFDCAAPYQGMALNEQLLQGPDLTSSLIGVITRFRQDTVAMMSDVEAMFHQVKVPENDSDLLRFLWWPGGDWNKSLTEHKMTVHLFGAVSSPSCASFALKRCAEDHCEQFKREVTDTVLFNFYVDDCLKSVPSEEAAISLCRDLTDLCAKGGFHLTKWVSNSRKVLDSLPQCELASKLKDLDLDQDKLPTERALGVNWCVESDTFVFKITIKDHPLTKRGLLSVTSSIYDPFGMLSPVALQAKTILQDICRLKIGWDDELPENIKLRWSNWLAGLSYLEKFKMERCIKPPGFGQHTFAQLHHFADASEYAYGTVSYLLLRNKDSQTHCAFMMGKSRVAPLRQPTIPRMELTAATVMVKMDSLLKRELQLDLKESVFWTDSTVVLKYLENEKAHFKTFVANRVSTILKDSKVEQWRYVNTKENPSDCASRGLSAKDFMKQENWISGPNFLYVPLERWPIKPDIDREPMLDHLEYKKVAVNYTRSIESEMSVKQLIDHYSSWPKLRRVTAWFLKLKSLLRTLCQKRKELFAISKAKDLNKDQQIRWIKSAMDKFKANFKMPSLSVEELIESEKEIIKYCQKEKFSDEILALSKGQYVSRKSHLYKLNPVLQGGVLRVGGRLSRAAMPEEHKHPAILPKSSHVVSTIIRKIHEDTGHGGRNHILSILRQKYWVPSANAAIRRVLSKCVVCRRLHGTTGKQKMADLPQDRVAPDDPPFTKVGVDYFGPIEVKRGRSLVKKYGVLFTCTTIRAVHIELASSLDTDSCINAIRRFIARRGQVKEFRSDNGTNFIGAERELAKAIAECNISKIDDFCLQRGIKWTFNPPTGSHHGGIWERLIRSIRKVLNSTVREQILDEESLHTFMCEAESILNSRPITKASSDLNDLEALTPNHLLLMKTKPLLPPGLFDKNDIYSRRRWKQVQYMSDLFWKRWTKEYLPQLQERQKWSAVTRNFVEGDIVVLVDDCAPRNSWIMGKVVKVISDKRGLVRRVHIKTKTNILDRPITKVCLLLEAE